MTEENSALGPIRWLASLLGGPPKRSNGIATIGSAETIQLERYYDIWRTRLQAASRSNALLSNGWAFSTLSGIASFESHIRATDFKSIYFNKIGEIDSIVQAVKDQLANRTIGGVMIYGYGDLYREAHFLECARNLKLLNLGRLSSQRVYLLDCSVFYHVFANSPLNPLHGSQSAKKLRIELLDYLDDADSAQILREWRGDLNVTKPVIHLFLGNTFCNTEADLIQRVLMAATIPGDIIVAEYANYPPDYFSDLSPDYVSEMAKVAAAELFSLPPDAVTTSNIALRDTAKATSISIQSPARQLNITFRSMLRRKFQSTELTENNPYQLISRQRPMDGKLFLDAFLRNMPPL